MSHFAYISGRGSLANWGIGTSVAPSEFWFFESSIYKCVNGDDGGAWSPSATIAFGGTYGMSFSSTTPLYAGGNTTIGTSTSNTLTVNATATCNGDATFTGDLTIGATGTTIVITGTGTMGVSKAIAFSGTADFFAATTFRTTTTIGDASSDQLYVNSTAFIYNNLTIGTTYSVETLLIKSATTQSGTIVFNADVAIAPTSGVMSGNESQSASNATVVRFVTNTASAHRTMTLLHADAVGGSMKIIKNNDSTYNVVVADETAGTIATLAAGTGGLFIFDGSQWQRAI